MTYFETPQDKAAHAEGITVEAYEAREDSLVAFREEFGYVDLPREDRPEVDEADVLDPDVPVFLGRYGSDDPGRWIPGSAGE